MPGKSPSGPMMNLLIVLILITAVVVIYFGISREILGLGLHPVRDSDLRVGGTIYHLTNPGQGGYYYSVVITTMDESTVEVRSGGMFPATRSYPRSSLTDGHKLRWSLRREWGAR